MFDPEPGSPRPRGQVCEPEAFEATTGGPPQAVQGLTRVVRGWTGGPATTLAKDEEKTEFTEFTEFLVEYSVVPSLKCFRMVQRLLLSFV